MAFLPNLDAVLQKRAEAKDYPDIYAILRHGVDLQSILAAAATIYGRKFNPLITLKALSYFDDVPALSAEVRSYLTRAVASVDHNPTLRPFGETIKKRDEGPSRNAGPTSRCRARGLV